MNLISLDEVLRIIEKRRHEWGNHAGEWRDAIDDIKALPSVEIDTGWIKCSDRMPEVGDIYLVSGVEKIADKFYPFVDAAGYGVPGYIDGCWNTFNDWVEGNEVHIIAWQKMPDPLEVDDGYKME